MKCRENKNMLSLYLDGLLDPEESVKIRRHLDACESCSQELLELQQIKSALQSIEPVKAPDSLLRSINERIDEENRISIFQSALKKILDFLTMRHAVEAAGVFAVAAVVVIILLPTIKNSFPPIETHEEKSPAVSKKLLSNKRFKDDRPPSPVPMDKLKGIAKPATEKRSRLRINDIGTQNISPVIIAFSLKVRDNENLLLEQNTADEASEEIRSERKISSIPTEKRASKKAKQYSARDYAPGSGKVSESDSFKSAPPAPKEKLIKRDTVSEIKGIAGKFQAVVKKLKNKKRLEVTIQGRKLKAFLNELEKIGSVRIMQKNLNERPGLIKIYINYE